MFSIDTILATIQKKFPDEFMDIRYRDFRDKFDLNSNIDTDAIIMPTNIINNRLIDRAVDALNSGVTLQHEFLGVFLFSRPIDVDRTMIALISALKSVPGIPVIITGHQHNPTIILERVFGAEGLNCDVNIFAIRFRAEQFIIPTKYDCDVCYTGIC